MARHIPATNQRASLPYLRVLSSVVKPHDETRALASTGWSVQRGRSDNRPVVYGFSRDCSASTSKISSAAIAVVDVEDLAAAWSTWGTAAIAVVVSRASTRTAPWSTRRSPTAQIAAVDVLAAAAPWSTSRSPTTAAPQRAFFGPPSRFRRGLVLSRTPPTAPSSPRSPGRLENLHQDSLVVSKPVDAGVKPNPKAVFAPASRAQGPERPLKGLKRAYPYLEPG
ncbi:hypothetical protein ES705_33406 [subsurface metagenome]